MCKSFASNSCFTQMMKNKSEFILLKWNAVCQITKVSVLCFYCPVNHTGPLEIRQLTFSLKIYIKKTTVSVCLLLVYSSHTNTWLWKTTTKNTHATLNLNFLCIFVKCIIQLLPALSLYCRTEERKETVLAGKPWYSDLPIHILGYTLPSLSLPLWHGRRRMCHQAQTWISYLHLLKEFRVQLFHPYNEGTEWDRQTQRKQRNRDLHQITVL